MSEITEKLTKSDGLSFEDWFCLLKNAAKGFEIDDRFYVLRPAYYDSDYSPEDAWQDIFENMEPDEE